MDEFLLKAQELLRKLSDVIYKTIAQGSEQITNFEEKALTVLNNAATEIQNEISENSKQNEKVQNCLKDKEPEFAKVNTQLKNKLVECYKKHYDPLDTLRAKRAKIHESASQLKLEVQKMVEECTKGGEPGRCFQQSLADLVKKAEELAKKFEAHIKKEAEITLKKAKLVQDCNKRAIAEAQKKYSKLLADVKKCAK